MGHMIHNVILHLNNEQPLVADLFDMPSVADTTLRCTNLRQLNGKRPVFVDHQHSVFYFAYLHIRFVEILPASLSEDERGHLPVPVGAEASGSNGRPPAEPEADLEIDEDFLRRIREV